MKRPHWYRSALLGFAILGGAVLSSAALAIQVTEAPTGFSTRRMDQSISPNLTASWGHFQKSRHRLKG